MDVVIKPARGLRGAFAPPGDKSISHRAVMLGALASGTSVIHGLLEAEDCLRTVEAFKALGVRIEGGEGSYRIQGVSQLKEPETILDMGNSGTGLRLLTGILAGERGCYSVLAGDSSLCKRPMDRIIEPLKGMGASISGRKKDTLPPLTIQGRSLQPFLYQLPIPSAQVKSALLFAGLRAFGLTQIEEPIPCRDHTERMMMGMGIPLEKRGSLLSIKGPARPKPFAIHIPGDISSAAFFVVAALLIKGSSLVIEGVGLNPTRSAFLHVLKRMGGKIAVKERPIEGGEPRGDLHVEWSQLKGVVIEGDEIPLLIDEIPVLVAAAALAKGVTTIRGALELRYKESDRIHCLVKEFSKLGLAIEELPDGMIIEGRESIYGGAECESFQDHRIGMALAVIGLASREGLSIHGVESINTSFPSFFQVVEQLTR